MDKKDDWARGLKIPCPFCGRWAGVRTSQRPTLLTVFAKVRCPSCGELEADFAGQLLNVKRAVFVDCPEALMWDKPENQYLKERNIKPLTNEQRLRQLRGEPELFDSEPHS